MDPSEAPSPPTEEQPAGEEHDVRYEARDVRLRPLMAFGAALGGLLLIVAGAMAALFGLFAEQVQRRPSEPASQAEIETAQQLQRLRQREEEVLNNHAWVDKQKGIVRIPIGRAMELVAEEAKEPAGETDDEGKQHNN